MRLRTVRKLHIWLGLFFSVFLLIEAATGLILSEPWLLGESQSQMRVEDGKQQNLAVYAGNGERKDQSQVRGSGSSNSLYHMMKTLHTGQWGGMNLKWVVDLTAIALIIVTITGVYFSVVLLRTSSKK